MIRNRTKNQLGSTPMRMPKTRTELDRAAAEHASAMVAERLWPRLAIDCRLLLDLRRLRKEPLGTPRHLHPGRRHRARDRRGHPARARGHRRRVRVGLPGRRRSTSTRRRATRCPTARSTRSASAGSRIKGPTTTPVGSGLRSINVALRKEFDLYACIRPCKAYEGVRTRFPETDIVIVRENTEDLYAGIEFEQRLRRGGEAARVPRRRARQPDRATTPASRSSRSRSSARSGSSSRPSSTRRRTAARRSPPRTRPTS